MLALSMDMSEKNKENKKIGLLIKEIFPHFIIILLLFALLIIDSVLLSGAFKLPLLVIIIGVTVIPLARKFLMKSWDKMTPITKRDDIKK
jgi:hypothetical protein